MDFDYRNQTGRPTGLAMKVLSRAVPGIGRVHGQIEPYAHAWRQRNLDALTRPGPRWVVLGDSLSQAIGAPRFDAGWVDQVRARLGLDHTVVNLSASGAVVRDVLETQLPAWRALPPRDPSAGAGVVGDVVDEQPDLLTVLVGANDLFRGANRDALPARFRSLVDQLPPRAVVATMPQPRAAARAVNQVLCSAPEVVVADLGQVQSWRGRLAEDHFHPDEAGYGLIADVFAPAVATAVRAAAARP